MEYIATTLLLVAFTGSLSAQQRNPVRGGIELEDGVPWPNATVTFLTRPVPADEQFGNEDRIVVTSDEKGRFWAKLIPGRRYSVWAVETLADGRYRASRIVEDFAAGNRLWLQARGEPRQRATIAVTGLDPWRRKGKLVVQALAASWHRDVTPLDVAKDGTATLPPLPGDRSAVEVLLDGAPLLPWPAAIDLTRSDPQAVRVRAPHPTRIRLVDSKGQPAAGVDFLLGTIDSHSFRRDSYHPIGTSNRNGQLVVELPIGTERDFSWHNYPAAMRGAGRSPLQWIGTLKIPADHDGHADDPVATFVLEDSFAWTGSVTVRGQPLRDMMVRVHTQCAIAADKQTGSKEVFWGAATDARGRLRIDVDPGYSTTVTAFPPSEILETFTTGSFLVHPVVGLLVIDAGGEGAKGALDLADLGMVDLQVLGPDGAPASAARVAIGLRNRSRIQSGLLRNIGTDHVGRVRILIPRRDDLEVAAWTANGSAVVPLDSTKANAEPLRLTLETVPTLTGTVHTADGKPLSHCRPRLYVSPEGGSSTLAWGLHPMTAQADGQGRFTLPLYPGLNYSIISVEVAGDVHHERFPRFPTDEPPEELDLRFRR